MTVLDVLSLLAGRGKTLEMMRWGGSDASWAEISPLAMAASRQGRMMALWTSSGMDVVIHKTYYNSVVSPSG
jgi:hypothetical protein